MYRSFQVKWRHGWGGGILAAEGHEKIDHKFTFAINEAVICEQQSYFVKLDISNFVLLYD